MSEGSPPITGELLSAYLDDALTPAERAAVEAALMADPRQRRELETLRAVRDRVRRLPQADLSPQVEDRLMAVLDGGKAPAREPVHAAPRPVTPVRRRWLPAVAFAAAAVVATLAWPNVRRAVPETGGGSIASAPATTVWDFTPQTLSRSYVYWNEKARNGELRPATSPDEAAAKLEEKVGYDVRPPDLDALQAKLVGCTACSQAFPSGQAAALFVMARQADPITLFEVTAPADRVIQHGFEPFEGTDVRVARTDQTNLALYSDDSFHVCLVSSTADAAELARLVPRAVRVAHRPDRARIQLVSQTP